MEGVIVGTVICKPRGVERQIVDRPTPQAKRQFNPALRASQRGLSAGPQDNAADRQFRYFEKVLQLSSGTCRTDSSAGDDLQRVGRGGLYSGIHPFTPAFNH